MIDALLAIQAGRPMSANANDLFKAERAGLLQTEIKGGYRHWRLTEAGRDSLTQAIQQ